MRNIPIVSIESAHAAAKPAAAVITRPRVSTIRSPTRSSRYPQGISVNIIPRFGIDASRAASTKLAWCFPTSAGIKKAAPLMKTLAHSVAACETPSMDQRRAVLADATSIATSSSVVNSWTFQRQRASRI
jgi:hypothetical protein